MHFSILNKFLCWHANRLVSVQDFERFIWHTFIRRDSLDLAVCYLMFFVIITCNCTFSLMLFIGKILTEKFRPFEI